MGVVRRFAARRTKFWLAGAVVVAVVAGSSVAVWLGSRDAAPEASASGSVDCSAPGAATEEAAFAAAAECEIDVEVESARTPWVRVWAQADGNGRTDVSAVPGQVEVDGEWVDVDRSLVADAGAGVLEVAAPAYAIELSAGDEAASELRPLGVIERGGERLEVWFPLELPEPVVEGPRATYELFDGVRLVVTVNSDTSGFSPVVVLDSPAAAARFEAALTAARAVSGVSGSGMTVAYRTVVSDGLRVVAAEGGAVSVVDEAGEEFFSAPPSVMWDSAGAAGGEPSVDPDPVTGGDAAAPSGEPDPSEEPVPSEAGAAVRVVSQRVEVAGGVVSVTPDAGMLADPGTVWPVFLDPSFSAKTPVEWTQLRTGGFTNSIYKWSNDIDGGSGRCTDSSCNAVYTSRVVWEFGGLDSIRNLVGGDVISGTLRVFGLHSYSCTAATTDAYLTNAISASSTWSSVGAGTVVGSRTESQRPSCGTDGWKAFTVTSAMKQLADNNWSTASIGLRARDESTMAGWKRFREDANLSAVWNRAPNKPTSVKVASPAAACDAGDADRPEIRSTTPTLSAVVSDPDGTTVQAHFQILAAGTTTEVWNSGTLPAKASGSTFTVTVPAGELANGSKYQYRVTATDADPVGARWSGWSTEVCEFRVDLSKPAAPTVTPLTGYPAFYEPGVERGGKSVQGAFKFTSTSTDVVSYKYGFGTNPPTTPVTGAAPTVTYTPSVTGPIILYVVSIDDAGNASSTTTYKFTVAAPKEDAVWTFDDVTLDGTAADTSGVGTAKTLTFVDGTAATTGPHGLFGARDNDGALDFDGAGDYAETNGPVLDTKKSFAVSAFVRLNETAVDKGKYYAAIAQDGLYQAGFRLMYQPSCTETGGDVGRGCWIFSMPNTDTATTTSTTVRSKTKVVGDEWVHLVGEHDAFEKKLRLWVCPVGTPEDPAAGLPVMSEQDRPATPWQAAGNFAVGRGFYNDAMNDWWPGQIDNVRLFQGEVVAEAKIRRMCQGAEATDLAGGNKAIDPTEKEPVQ